MVQCLSSMQEDRGLTPEFKTYRNILINKFLKNHYYLVSGPHSNVNDGYGNVLTVTFPGSNQGLPIASC